MKKLLRRFRALRGKMDSVALLLAFINAVALEVDFSDCVCDIEMLETSFLNHDDIGVCSKDTK